MAQERRIKLPRPISRVLRAGTDGYARADRQGLIVANVTGYLATFSSLVYALIYALHDPVNLRPVVLGNIVSAICTAATPFFHRFGPSAAALWLAIVIFSTIFYFIAFLGRDSGIQLNYLGAAAGALAILGLTRLWLAVAITACGARLPSRGLVSLPGCYRDEHRGRLVPRPALCQFGRFRSWRSSS